MPTRMRPKKDPDRTGIHVDVPRSLRDQFKLETVKEGKTMRAALLELIEGYIRMRRETSKNLNSETLDDDHVESQGCNE